MTLADLFNNISFSTLFEAAADAMLLVDSGGKVLLANASALKMFIYTEGEITGLRVEALMPAKFSDLHQQHRDRFFKTPEKRSMGKGKNLLVLTKEGNELPVDIGLSPIQIEEQHFVVVTFHETTKQILAETSLSASEERLRLAKLAAGLGVFDIDLQLDSIHCDEHVNQIFGFLPDGPVTYNSFFKTIDLTDQPLWQAVYESAIKPENGSDFNLEFKVNNLIDKSQYWVSAAGSVFFNENKPVRLLGVVQNITDKKLLTKQLSEQRIELENLSKQQVAIQTASAIAHEINQPLAAISAYSEVALYALDNESLDTEKLNRSLSGCVAQAQRAGNSLHELMEFLHKGEVTSIPINLNEIVHEALGITKDGYGLFHSTLNLEPELPKVLANRIQLQKVLVNLLRNSVEAVQNSGAPIAKINIEVSTHAELSMAEVTIQDNGPGLDQEVRDRIFEPFFTTKPHGIGMGLAISRTLIEACGGQLWLDPDTTVGAKFHITLPFVRS